MTDYYHLASLFECPVWHKLTQKQIIALTDKEVEELKQKQSEIDNKNREKLIEINKEISNIKSSIAKIFGNNSKEYKYTNKFSIYIPFSYSFKSSILDVREKYHKEINSKLSEETNQKANNQYLTDAIVYLINKGKNIGVDFTTENAISWAEQIAEDEEIDRKINLGIPQLFDFSGNNCDGPCNGWDGTSHRCECGNRRVDWVRGDGFTFKNPYIYAEAY